MQALIQHNPRRSSRPVGHSLGPRPLPDNLPLLRRAQPPPQQLTSLRRPSHIRSQRPQTGEPCRAPRPYPRWGIFIPLTNILFVDHTVPSCSGSPGGGFVDLLRDRGRDCVSGAIHAQLEEQLACVCGFGTVERGGRGVRADSCRVYLGAPAGS